MKFEIWEFSGNMLRKFKFHYILVRITGILREFLRTLMIISRWISIKTRNIYQTKFAEKVKTHIWYAIIFVFRKFCHLWDRVEECGTDRQVTLYNIMRRRKYTICIRITKVRKQTSTHNAAQLWMLTAVRNIL